jgi:hypothetical protein
MPTRVGADNSGSIEGRMRREQKVEIEDVQVKLEPKWRVAQAEVRIGKTVLRFDIEQSRTGITLSDPIPTVEEPAPGLPKLSSEVWLDLEVGIWATYEEAIREEEARNNEIPF